MDSQIAMRDDLIYEQTVRCALELEEIRQQLKAIEKDESEKIAEMKLVKSKLQEIEKNEKVLSTRNMTMREKMTELEEHVKSEAVGISQEMKQFFKKLGVKVQIDNKGDLPPNLIELRIHFAENKDYSVNFVYDSVTEDYDLRDLQPEHPNYRELRQMLRQTKDIQGFLFNYRNKILKTVMGNKEGLTSSSSSNPSKVC